MAALKLREGAATRVTLRQSTPFQTQKVQSKKTKFKRSLNSLRFGGLVRCSSHVKPKIVFI